MRASVWRAPALWFFNGGLLAGAVVTGALGFLVGVLVRPIFPGASEVVVICGVVLWVLLIELGLIPRRWPAARRQVPSEVVGRGSRLGAAQFGFEMGTGARTYMPTPLPYVALSIVALVAGVTTGLLTALGFGIGRAAMATARYYAPDVDAWDRELNRRSALIRWVLLIASSGCAVGLAFALAG